jgi:hypothetical protein
MYTISRYVKSNSSRNPLKYSEQYLSSDEDLERLARRLRTSAIFLIHTEYVRMQFIYSLLQVCVHN